MIAKTFKQLGEVNIDLINCDEVLNEATQIITLAIEMKTIQEYERVRSFHHSQNIKRGIQWKKDNGYNRHEEFKVSK